MTDIEIGNAIPPSSEAGQKFVKEKAQTRIDTVPTAKTNDIPLDNRKVEVRKHREQVEEMASWLRKRGYNISYLTTEADLLKITVLDFTMQPLREGLPESIGVLKNLETLILDNTDLKALPESLCSLTKLKRLEIHGSLIENLPTNFCDLTSLTHLTIYKGKLKSLPKNIGNLKNLEELKLNRNELTRLPSSITSLTQLNQLVLYHNKLEELPDDIGNMEKLKQLYLVDNNLIDLPQSLLDRAEKLNIHVHVDQNPLPDEIKLALYDYNEKLHDEYIILQWGSPIIPIKQLFNDDPQNPNIVTKLYNVKPLEEIMDDLWMGTSNLPPEEPSSILDVFKNLGNRLFKK